MWAKVWVLSLQINDESLLVITQKSAIDPSLRSG